MIKINKFMKRYIFFKLFWKIINWLSNIIFLKHKYNKKKIIKSYFTLLFIQNVFKILKNVLKRNSKQVINQLIRFSYFIDIHICTQKIKILCYVYLSNSNVIFFVTYFPKKKQILNFIDLLIIFKTLRVLIKLNEDKKIVV